MTASLNLLPFKDLIKRRCGLTLDGLAEETLLNAIRKRMAQTNAPGPAEYLVGVTTGEDEFHEFVTLLTINETYFYREPEQLALLVDRLMPRLLAEDGTGRPIRILSAGCASGEEPYSIAIALLERYGESAARMVQILGGDIDRHTLAKARAGRYTQFSFRGLPTELRERYFRSAGRDGYVIDERVASMVSFHHLNLLAEDFPAELSNLDVVFFRNVSIYFDEPTRRAIHATLHRATTDRGHVVTGSAETLANDFGIFSLVEDGGAFYFAKAPQPAPIPKLAEKNHFETIGYPTSPALTKPLESPGERLAVPSLPPPPPAEDIDVEAVRALIRAKQFDRAQAMVAPRNRLAPADSGLLALDGYARLMERDFDAAADLGNRALAADEWSVEAMVLLGLVARWRDQRDEAICRFKQAVYGRHECWPAHYYLAELYRASGAADQAKRSYRLVLQQIAAKPDPDGGLLLPLGLPTNEVRFLCERHAGAATTIAARR
jgi:chemotaxis protein methyltransferase CheR